MALKTYPLDNVDYSAEDAELFHCTRTSGIYAGDDFDYSVTGADNTITIGPGIAWIRNSRFSGKVAALTAAMALDAGLPDAVYPRIDAVAIQFDANKNSTEVVLKRGTAASAPIPPAVSQSEALYELHLYHVRRKPGAAAISVSDITDLRLDPNCCGLMADSVTRVDTAAISAQVMALIEELRAEIGNVKDGSAYLMRSGGNMTGAINMNGQALKGLNAPMAEDEAANMGYVKRAYPHNLLDNSDFRNPVNQRGKTSYSGQGYSIDRWKSWNNENVITVNSGSVSCTKQLYQCVDPQKLKPDTRYTLAAHSADGTVYCVSGQLGEKTENEKLHMEFQAETPAVWLSGGSWLWAALYEGEYTAETLPEYRPKGYGAELAECQRYFLQYNFSDVILPAKMYSGGGSADVSFFLPCTMRLTKPTVSVTASQCQLFANSSNTSCNITEAYLATGNFVGFTAVAESNLDGSAVAVCRIMGKLTLSADL